MESKIKKTFEIVLTLNEKEAQWLMSVVQNPINQNRNGSEWDDDYEIRIALFNALKKGLYES